jgi:hypothetical protein
MRKFAPAESTKIGLVDYELLGQMVWHMNSDNATWEQLRPQIEARGYTTNDIAEARRVVPVTPENGLVPFTSWMALLHLGYFAVKLGMPVFGALQTSEIGAYEATYIYAVWRASGEPTFFDTESQMEAEMHKEPPPVAPLFLPPPLFLLSDHHWTLHQPKGTLAQQPEAIQVARRAHFQRLFPRST